MTRQIISTDTAPAAIGPYSQAVRVNGCLYVSGQIPLDPRTERVVEGGITEQAKQVLDNLGAILKKADLSFKDVAKVTIFIKDIEEFDSINKVYKRYFSSRSPARSTVEVSRLPKGVEIEIDAIACYGESSKGGDK